MFNPKFSVILSNVGQCCDRYLSTGYSEAFSLERMFDRVASVNGVFGVELVGNWHIRPDNVARIKENLGRTGLKLVSIIPDHFGEMKWGKGAFSSKDRAIRTLAVDSTKALIDAAAELGCRVVSLWPGQDGYDYPFQGDYIQERQWFEEGVKACCRHNRDIDISIEYKIKEPRNFSYPSSAANVLLMLQAIDEANCGVTIDYGHAHVAYENVAESVALLKKHGNKLFHVHMNDNYGYWDDDMITGSIHTIPFIEFFYWLKRTGYEGWISTDQYPYREDGRDAVNESVRWMQVFAEVADGISQDALDQIWKTGNACEVSALMRKIIFNK